MLKNGGRLTEEHKRKIGESNKGKLRTVEQRKRMSLAFLGRIPWNKGLVGIVKQSLESIEKRRIKNTGKKRTEETKKRMSEAQQRRCSKYAVHPMVGFKHSEESKRRMSQIQKKVFSERPELKKIISERQKGKNNSNYNFFVGKNNPKWKGGITPLTRKIRSCFEYRNWRIKIYQRDNFTCVLCGNNKSGNLNADHIKPFYKIIEENNIKNLKEAIICQELWDINNGRTLCVECHKGTESFPINLKLPKRVFTPPMAGF